MGRFSAASWPVLALCRRQYGRPVARVRGDTEARVMVKAPPLLDIGARVPGSARARSEGDTSSTGQHEAGPFRRLAAEVVGTFFLVTAAAGADIVADLHPGQVSNGARAVAPALVVAAMIYALGSVSGVHINPA